MPTTRSENRPKRKAPKTAFQPGKSGNPGGRPKLPEDVKHVRELAREYTVQAVETLVDVMDKGGHAARVAAANAILERGWGKAEQPIVGDPANPLAIAIIERRIVKASGN